VKCRASAWLFPVVALAMHVGACSASSSSSAGAGDAGADAAAGVDVTGVHYEPHGAGDDLLPLAGGPSDDALRALLLQGASTTTGASVPVFDAPTSGATLAGSTPPTFTWHGPSAMLRPLRPKEPRRPRAPSLLDAFLGEGVAHAHLPPYNGMAYYLELRTPKLGAVYRMFTAFTRATPDAASWQKLAASGETARAVVRLGRFTDSRLDPDGSPFESAPISFTVQP
jgi:hypothetical protein